MGVATKLTLWKRSKDDMEVKTITAPFIENIELRPMSIEQLRNEISYIRAEQLINKLLDMGLITEEECDKIRAECRCIFSSYLADLYPESVDMSCM